MSKKLNPPPSPDQIKEYRRLGAINSARVRSRKMSVDPVYRATTLAARNKGNINEFKAFRLRCSMTQKEFALAVGISFQSVQNFENGRALPIEKTRKSMDSLAFSRGVQGVIWGVFFD